MKEQVLAANDIVAVIGERIALKQKGRDYVGLCPFHDDHKPSMSVSPTKQIFKCWSCGTGGDVIKFVQLYEKVDFRNALELLAKRAGLDFRTGPEREASREAREALQQAMNWARDWFHRNLNSPLGREALAYADRRGISRESLESFRIGFAPDSWSALFDAAGRVGVPARVLHQAGLVSQARNGNTVDRFRNRLIFPIHDSLGRIIAFGGRTLGDDPAKYLNSPETALFSKSRILYGFDRARRPIGNQRSAIVVEGYLDAILLAQNGFDHAVATLGTAVTEAHIKLLTPSAETIYLCFDGDVAGETAAERAVETSLRSGADVRVAMFPVGKDPADCLLEDGAESFSEYLQSARDALQFKWERTVRAFEGGNRAARRKAVETYLQFVARLTSERGSVDPLQQGLLIGRLSELLAIPAATVHEMLESVRRSGPRGVRPSSREVVEAAAYDEAIQGVSEALVNTIEEIFGLLLVRPECYRLLDDAIVDVAAEVPVWRDFLAMLADVLELEGVYTRAEIIRRCDDPVLCDLIGRACQRTVAETSVEEAFLSARARLTSELEALRLSGLRQALHASGGETAAAEAKWRELLSLAGRQTATLLPAEYRLKTPKV